VSSSTSTFDDGRRNAASFIACFLGFAVAITGTVAGVNLAVDPSHEFGLSLADESELAGVLARGSAAVVEPILNLHVVRRDLMQRIAEQPQVVVLGSSRSWEFSAGMFPGRRFLNSGTSSATLDDYVALWGMLQSARARPEAVVFETDPWIFNRANPPLSHCTQLAAEFRRVETALGGVSVHGCLANPPYRQLLSLPNLMTSLTFVRWLHDPQGCGGICPAPTQAAMPSRGDLWHPDGSLNHYRVEAEEAVMAFARGQGETSPRFKFFDGMAVIDQRMVTDWRNLLMQVRSGGTAVLIYLSPFHPAYLAGIAGHRGGDLVLLDEVESVLRRMAAELGIPLVGSYRPDRASCRLDEFYDSIHIHPSCIARILAGAAAGA
jgi:hypothetical protein